MTLATSQSSDSCSSHPHRLPSPPTVCAVSRLYKLCSRPSSSSPCVCSLALPNRADCSACSPERPPVCPGSILAHEYPSQHQQHIRPDWMPPSSLATTHSTTSFIPLIFPKATCSPISEGHAPHPGRGCSPGLLSQPPNLPLFSLLLPVPQTTGPSTTKPDAGAP